MSLSPLYTALTNDLHVSIAADLHQPFDWLHPRRVKITSFRVYIRQLCTGAPVNRCTLTWLSISAFAAPLRLHALARSLTQLLNPCFETGGKRRPSRRGSADALPRLPFKIIVSRLLSNPFESTFHLSLTLLDTLSDLDLYLALDEEYHPYSYYTLKQYYYASQCKGANQSCTVWSGRFNGTLPPLQCTPTTGIQAWHVPVRSPLLGESRFDFFSWAY
ncbi:Conserved_hypothetical protein [Hexamita inflata]|uniref:Uncharacterized protein n=1 Tax=Hexamita inflata TaxID=28002 RepID=A0ABP1MNC1_9EUKA